MTSSGMNQRQKCAICGKTRRVWECLDEHGSFIPYRLNQSQLAKEHMKAVSKAAKSLTCDQFEDVITELNAVLERAISQSELDLALEAMRAASDEDANRQWVESPE